MHYNVNIESVFKTVIIQILFTYVVPGKPFYGKFFEVKVVLMKNCSNANNSCSKLVDFSNNFVKRTDGLFDLRKQISLL